MATGLDVLAEVEDLTLQTETAENADHSVQALVQVLAVQVMEEVPKDGKTILITAGREELCHLHLDGRSRI